MPAACPTKVFAVPASNPSRYNYKMMTCHPRAMANRARTGILVNKQRFSKGFHRFFRGRVSMKKNWRIAAFCCELVICAEAGLCLSLLLCQCRSPQRMVACWKNELDCRTVFRTIPRIKVVHCSDPNKSHSRRRNNSSTRSHARLISCRRSVLVPASASGTTVRAMCG